MMQTVSPIWLMISSSLLLCASLSVLCFVTHLLRVKHPNILQLVDVFETKKEYFLFLELWVQMSDDPREKALCLPLRSLGPAELCVLIIHSWEMSYCSLRPGRYENSSELHSFGIQIWLLASCSILISVCSWGVWYISMDILVLSIEDTWLVGLGILVRKKMIKRKRNIYRDKIKTISLNMWGVVCNLVRKNVF